MNARVLRKWSPTKYLMYLWPVVLLSLVIWSPSATSMHILPNTRGAVLPAPSGNNMPRDDLYGETSDHRNRMRPAYYYAPEISYSTNQRDPPHLEVFIRAAATASDAVANAANVPHVPKLNSQVINLNSLTSSANIESLSSSSVSSSSSAAERSKRRHVQPHRTIRDHSDDYSEVLALKQRAPSASTNVETRVHERHERVSPPQPNGSSHYRTGMMAEDDEAYNEYAAARIPDPINLERQNVAPGPGPAVSAGHLLVELAKEAHRRRLMRLKQLATNNYSRTIRPAAPGPTPATAAAAASAPSPKQLIDNDLNKLMIGRNRRDSRLHLQSAHHRQQRKRPRRYCSAQDPMQLAFEAPTVFEGKIMSMSYDRRANFSVTFEVKEIFKKQPGFKLPPYLRLQFTYRNTSAECDIYRERMRPRGIVRDELEQSRVYILFVQQSNLGNFTILGRPIRKTTRAVEGIRKVVSENYAQPASIRSLTASKRIVENGEELRIVCKVRGQPPPKVTWFKDDKSINRNRRLYQIIHLKKRSELIVKSFNSSDAGLYECRAKNKGFRKLEKRTIRIEAFSRPTDESYSHSTGDECTGNFEQYCLNGGTCQYFREISIPSCECPDGFVGDRCQEKEWNNVTPNPTFKTGFMADGPSPVESDEDDDDDSMESEEVPPTKDTVFSNKLT